MSSMLPPGTRGIALPGFQASSHRLFSLLVLLGADVKATTKDGDTVFTCIIFLLGETVGGDKEEAQLINRFCFQVTQLLLAHGADPSECPAHESLTHICLKSFISCTSLSCASCWSPGPPITVPSTARPAGPASTSSSRGSAPTQAARRTRVTWTCCAKLRPSWISW